MTQYLFSRIFISRKQAFRPEVLISNEKDPKIPRGYEVQTTSSQDENLGMRDQIKGVGGH